jgi:hypothetical protein
MSEIPAGGNLVGRYGLTRWHALRAQVTEGGLEPRVVSVNDALENIANGKGGSQNLIFD